MKIPTTDLKPGALINWCGELMLVVAVNSSRQNGWTCFTLFDFATSHTYEDYFTNEYLWETEGKIYDPGYRHPTILCK